MEKRIHCCERPEDLAADPGEVQEGSPEEETFDKSSYINDFQEEEEWRERGNSKWKRHMQDRDSWKSGRVLEMMRTKIGN